jgi:hypothetical protein
VSDEQIKKLELRIVELEKKLESATKRSAVGSLSEEEIKAYNKVREAIAADWGDFCGINDCFRCIVVRCGGGGGGVGRCIVRCINECSCGPCAISFGDYATNGLGRFGGMGG